MESWFTVEKIDGQTFAISEYRHWEETHCYLICGREQALLLDTGLGVANIKKVVDALTDLPVQVATTHVHWDHIGGHRQFPQIAVHEAEVQWLSGAFPIPLQMVKQNLLAQPCDFPEDFDPDAYEIFQGTPETVLRDGDCLSLGDREVTVLHTPGHSPGHCCFYEPERGYLYAGDLIYSGCLDAFYPSTDPQLFFQSVRRICALKPKRILPGHHKLHIPAGLADEIERGFSSLEERGLLRQGSGLFDFGAFQIHI